MQNNFILLFHLSRSRSGAILSRVSVLQVVQACETRKSGQAFCISKMSSNTFMIHYIRIYVNDAYHLKKATLLDGPLFIFIAVVVSSSNKGNPFGSFTTHVS